MSGNLSDFAFGGGIKSIQRGVISLSGGPATATITAVNTAKAVLHHLGGSTNSSAQGNGALVLTNSTTITATWGSVTGTVAWQLVEYF